MNEDINNKLKTWKVEPEVPVRFRAGVWGRIAACEREKETSLAYHVGKLFLLLARPRYAMTFASLVLFVSIATANIQARETNSALWKNLETRYVTSIDPRSHALAMR